jgi:hypothetical protein
MIRSKVLQLDKSESELSQMIKKYDTDQENA